MIDARRLLIGSFSRSRHQEQRVSTTAWQSGYPTRLPTPLAGRVPPATGYLSWCTDNSAFHSCHLDAAESKYSANSRLKIRRLNGTRLQKSNGRCRNSLAKRGQSDQTTRKCRTSKGNRSMKPVAFELAFLLTIACAWPLTCRADDTKPKYADPPMPAYRVDTEGFKASDRDIRAVCDSAGRELWRYFTDHNIETFVVTRGHNGPIVLHNRNDRGEIVMRLDTERECWCQYSYQFAHEFCHILCGYKKDPGSNQWFEETICETASLFVMRAMARAWATDPPYPHWKDYRDSLQDYTDDVIAKRHRAYEIYEKGLPTFYREHEGELRSNAVIWELNGAMSILMLRLFEEEPQHWEAVRWLNSTPSGQNEAFSDYLQRWHNAVPDRHQPFIRRLAGLFGVEIASTAPHS